jgi:hypothetical protein
MLAVVEEVSAALPMHRAPAQQTDVEARDPSIATRCQALPASIPRAIFRSSRWTSGTSCSRPARHRCSTPAATLHTSAAWVAPEFIRYPRVQMPLRHLPRGRRPCTRAAYPPAEAGSPARVVLADGRLSIAPLTSSSTRASASRCPCAVPGRRCLIARLFRSCRHPARRRYRMLTREQDGSEQSSATV